MTIPTGTISRLPTPLAPAIGWSVNGAGAGARHNHWPMRRARARRGVFPPEVRVQATAIACSLPRTQAVPLARWSRAELARRVAATPELPRVSPSTVGRWLQAEKIRPWRFRLWQHIQNPTAFLERARPVLQLYAQATALLQSGTWVVCADEK